MLESCVSFTSKYSSCAHIKYYCRQWRETRSGKKRHLKRHIPNTLRFGSLLNAFPPARITRNSPRIARDWRRATIANYTRDKKKSPSPRACRSRAISWEASLWKIRPTAKFRLRIAEYDPALLLPSRINCPADSRKRGNFYVAVAIVDCHRRGAARARTDEQARDRGGEVSGGAFKSGRSKKKAVRAPADVYVRLHAQPRYEASLRAISNGLHRASAKR